jgi:nicotinate-nucleotide pyrophosphorylase (carboxylating)
MEWDGGHGFPAGDWLDTLVRRSLEEDLGETGDVSTQLAVDPARQASGAFVARGAGVVAGLPAAALVYAALPGGVNLRPRVPDGAPVAPGEVIAEVSGPAAAVLTGERTALNFLQHLSGIATLTSRYVAAVAGTACRVLDTRKTLPGYRHLAKYAVRCGGGHNHRMGLYDRIMLKDNHWAARAASVAELVARARRERPGLAIEIEVDSLEQLADVLPLGVEWVLLDNFGPDQVVRAVAARDASGASTLLEASGNVTLETIAALAAAGADAASVGRLTHSVTALDIGLDLESA